MEGCILLSPGLLPVVGREFAAAKFLEQTTYFDVAIEISETVALE